ncbi:hypothetical protein PSI19_18345 [Xenorhabdus khoisanae]|uniref:DUF6685 family protein n=1 Tax=Xenorhabdus khoisanae TaxID=880157 RepID=UPI0023596C61|nr:DUF6685 family protein [Xenorhabdus khoisanae]MDC9615795.1 hypothetical protein [Xenorhabdus khoisanae]
MSMRKIANKVITLLYKTTQNYRIDRLDKINLNKIELFKPTADSNTFLCWNDLFEGYLIRDFPPKLTSILNGIIKIDQSLITDFDFNKIQSLSASKSFGGMQEGHINGSWFDDLYHWGKGMYPDDNLKAEKIEDWNRNISHIEREGFPKYKPIDVIYYAWLDRYLAPNSGGSHHAAMVVYQSIKDKLEYKREVNLEHISLDENYINALDNDYYSFIIENDCTPDNKSTSESVKFIDLIRVIVSDQVYILKPVHYHQSLSIIFISKQGLKIEHDLFVQWINSAHKKQKIIELPTYFRSPKQYQTKPYLHALRFILLGNPRRVYSGEK